MKLFGAKRQPSNVHADCKKHDSKLKADLAHQKVAFEREIVAHERIRVSQANEITELHTLAAIAKEDAAQGKSSLQRQVSDLEFNLRTNKLLKDGLELELSDLKRTLTELKSTMATAEVDSKSRSSNLESEVSNLKICLNDARSQAIRAKEDFDSITGHMKSANENHVTVLKEAHTEALLEEQRRLVNVHQTELCSLKLQLQKEHDILSATALLEQQSRLSAQHHAAVTSLEEQNNSSIKALEERKHSELECLKTNMMDEKDRELAELGSKLEEEHEFKYGQLKSLMAREYSEKSLALQIELNAEKDAALEQQCKVLRQEIADVRSFGDNVATDLNGRLQTASDEKDGLKLQFDEHRRLVRHEISDLTARLQRTSVEKDGLETALEDQRTNLRQEISDLTKRLQSTSLEKDRLEFELDEQRMALRHELADLTERLQGILHEKDALNVATGRLQGILHEKDALNVALEDQSRSFCQEVEELMSSSKATIAELTERVHKAELKRDAFDRMVTELTSTSLPIFALSYHDLRYGVRLLGCKSKPTVDFDRSRISCQIPVTCLQQGDICMIMIRWIRALNEGMDPTILDGGSALIRIWKTWEDPQVHIQTKEHLYWLLYNFCWKVIKHANKPQNPLHQWLLFQIISAVVVYSPADEASDVLHQAMGSVVQMEGNDLSRLGLMGLHHLHETINARLQARRLAFSLHLTVPWDTARECTWHIDCRDVQSGIVWLSSYTELEGHCHIVLRQKGTMSPVLIFHCNVAESGFLWFGASQYLVIIQQNHTDMWEIIVRQPGFREWSDDRIVDVSQALLSNLRERAAEAI